MSQPFASGGQSIEFQLQHQSFQWTPRTDLLLDGLVRTPLSLRNSQESSPASQFNDSFHWSHPYMTNGKTIALTRWTFVDKVMSLLSNMQSRLVITFLPRSKRLLISWLSHHLQWFWSPQNKVWHCFHCFPVDLPWSDGTRCHDLRFLNVEI